MAIPEMSAEEKALYAEFGGLYEKAAKLKGMTRDQAEAMVYQWVKADAIDLKGFRKLLDAFLR